MAQHIKELLVEYTVKYGFQVLAGLIILFVGYKIAEWTAKVCMDLCHKKHMDVTLTKFLGSVVKWTVFAFAILMAAEKFGITISPLIASISALIFGASFAIQAPLSNYAAGLSIILTRPFVVGNTITIQGVHGQVEEVKLACTILATGDGEKISIPNKEVVGQILVNSHEVKVVAGVIGIGYDEDPNKAIRVIEAAVKSIPHVTSKPEPKVGIASFGDFAVNIDYRFWVPTERYLQTVHEVNAAVYKAVKGAGITIPYPRREVYTFSGPGARSSAD